MSAAEQTSYIGPAAFFGLCAYALVTAGPAPVSDDPRERMDMKAASTGAGPLAVTDQSASPKRFAYLAQISRASPPGIAPPVRETGWRVDPPLPRLASFAPAVLGAAVPGGVDLPEVSQTRRAAAPRWIASGLPTPRAAQEAPRLAALPLAVLSADQVHLRAAPSARAAVLGQFDSGTKMQVIGPAGNWTKVIITREGPPLSGWFYTEYLAR